MIIPPLKERGCEIRKENDPKDSNISRTLVFSPGVSTEHIINRWAKKCFKHLEWGTYETSIADTLLL